MTVSGSIRPGGRSARVREAVRSATLAELAEKGYGALTVENVAVRSGVHKTTVYRRWSSAEGLIADALDLATNEPWPVPDTGTVRGDLRALNRMVVAGFADPGIGAASRAFVGASIQNAGAAQALHRFFAARHIDAVQVVIRAIGSGELPASVDPVELVRIAVAPLYYRMFVSQESVDETIADRAADSALAAAQAGVLDG